MLVNGTRERAPLVRSRSEIALISLIRLNKPDSIMTVIFFRFYPTNNLGLKRKNISFSANLNRMGNFQRTNSP